jgi:hypothetical protein
MVRVRTVEKSSVKGRGIVVIIDSLPPEIEVGMFVALVEDPSRRWKVCGIETHAMPRSHTDGKSAGLLLAGDTPLPAIGCDIELVPSSATR